MVIELHAKNKLNICKPLKEKPGKLSHLRPIISPMEHKETQTLYVRHGDSFTGQKSAQYLQEFRKKVRKTVGSLTFTEPKAGNFAQNQLSVTKLKRDL